MSFFSYMLTRGLLQSALAIAMITMLSFIGIHISAQDPIAVSIYLVGAVMLAKMATMIIFLIRGITLSSIGGQILGYLMTTGIATVMVLLFAPIVFPITIAFTLFIILTVGDILGWLLLWSAGATPYGRRN